MFHFSLKPIDHEAIPRALAKADRYRLLDEPEEAESICLDILAIDPDNQEALITLLLALTDQFETGCGDCAHRARELLPRIRGQYERNYYTGILHERSGSSLLDGARTGSSDTAYARLLQAMEWYEKAEAVRPEGNDDAILRWNTCARMIMQNHLEPEPGEAPVPIALE